MSSIFSENECKKPVINWRVYMTENELEVLKCLLNFEKYLEGIISIILRGGFDFF